MPCTDWLSDSERRSRADFGNEWAREERTTIVEVPAPVVSYQERQLRRAVAVLHEFQTGNHVDPDEFNCVNHTGIEMPASLNAITHDLCAMFHSMETSAIQAMSLEAQIWYRDHLIMDAKRHQAELDAEMADEQKRILDEEDALNELEQRIRQEDS